MEESKLCLTTAIILLPFFIVMIRFLQVTPALSKNRKNQHPELVKNIEGAKIMILLGSGGHTGEMIRLLTHVKLSNLSRVWVTSSNDNASLEKAKDYEKTLESNYTPEYFIVHRARNVGDSLIITIINTIKSLVSIWTKVFNMKELPKVLILNGPGTSVPLAYIIFVMKFFGICNTKIIYVESLARVGLLSLSGKLLLPITDRFIVQWEQLAEKYKRAEYYGILV